MHLSPHDDLIVDRKAKLVGWGLIYSEVWNQAGTVLEGTSCMTTNAGPITEHYSSCNIQWVCRFKNGWSKFDIFYNYHLKYF